MIDTTIETKAVEVSFLKKTKWAGTGTRMLALPVRELSDRCVARRHRRRLRRHAPD